MWEPMNKLYNLLMVAFMLIMTVSACEKPEPPHPDEPTVEYPTVDYPLCTYVYDGTEYPVHSVDVLSSDSQILIRISPFKKDEKQTTYAVIGINASLEGMEIDVDTAWHNDDYYFIYETPLMYYSQFRELRSGKIRISRSGVMYDILADVALADGKEFTFKYKGQL